MSLEAKDIYAAMTLENREEPYIGYDVRDKNGDVSLRKFENVLDWSLDTIQLRDAYYKATRRKDFYFYSGGKRYTQVVINVKFSYAFKEFNKAGKNTYIRAGYAFRDCKIEDGCDVRDGKLIAIQTNVEVLNPVSSEVLGKYFSFVDGHYVQSASIPTLMTRAELRDYLYRNGFVCDGMQYVRYKRSSGSSRVGKCLFVNKVVESRMSRWDRCGLPIKEGQPIDLAAYEAYIALPMSSIIDTMWIDPRSILVVDDYISNFEDDVVAVEAKDGRLVAEDKRMPISNSIWDGESLMDSSMFGKYADKGMLLLRNRFFKTCAFNTNLQQWFQDNDITDISQLNGFTLADDISEIKLITTPSSIKYLKFGTIDDWLANIEPIFGIVKYEKETHFFDGRMVQCHYQLLNTLQLSRAEMEALLKPSIDYIGLVRSDPDVLRYHIGYPFRAIEEDGELNPLKSKNDIVFRMLGINNDFGKTQLYKDFRNDIVKGFMRNLKQGHLLLHGNYSTLLGNGVELLQQAIGKFSGESVISSGCFHTKKFAYNRTILASRSPHITMGNVLLAKNVESELIDTYFNMSNEIVYVNAIGENIQQRLDGCDYDSDTILITDNDILIKAAERNYETFKVPTNFVESQKTARFYTCEQKSDLDIKTSVNKIGEIVNLSQFLNSILWDRVSRGEAIENCKELYDDICKLAVLSGIEIDKAKREYVVDSVKEIAILRKKYRLEDGGVSIKPMFFKMITLENGYDLSEKIQYRDFKTAMDYLQRIIASSNFRQARAYKIDVIPFMDIVKKPAQLSRGGYAKISKDKIISVIREAKEDIRKLYIDYDVKTADEKKRVWESVAERRQECINEIDKMSEDEYTMYLTLKELDNKDSRDVYRFVFEVLFGKPNEAFFKLIADSREDLYELIEDINGDIKIYDMSFKKVKVNNF